MYRHLFPAFCAVLISLSAVAEETMSALRGIDRSGRTVVSKKCAEPENIVRELVKNQYEPQVKDEIQVYTCSGFTVQIYSARSSNVPRELPMRLTITQQHPYIPKALSIGSRVMSVRKILGTPYRQDRYNLIYSTNEEMPGSDTVTYRISNEKVQAIEWSWEVD